MNIEGQIVLSSSKHEVEYEPSGQTGLSTLYLRVKGNNHNVPIYVDSIDDIIEMLQKGKDIIDICEGL